MSDKDSPPPIDPAAGQKAFNAIRPRLLSIPATELATVNVDVQKAAIAAAAVGRMVQEPKVRARFKSLPKAEFEQAHVDDLETVALGLWYASIELLTAGANSTEAKLPVSLVQQATAVKQRMLKLLEYHFEDDPVDGPEIASIKQGTGYADLASDLTRLAKLYKKRQDEIKLDPKYYVASDASDARKHAQEIMHLLGEAKNQDEKSWSDLVVRGFTLLMQIYDEVSTAGRWLYRNEDGEELFPSLYAVARPSGGRPKKNKGAGGDGSPGVPAKDPT